MTYLKNWEKTKLGDIGRYLNGKAFKSGEWRSTGRPIIRIQNLTGSGSEFNYFQGEVEDRYVVMPGDLLFSWSATLGTYIWQGPEAVLNQHIFKVESFIDKNFHRYLLDFKIQEMQSQTHGSGMVHITKKSFDAIEVHIPPIDEQHKIVDLLDDHLSRLDAALADVKQAKIKAVQFRRSLLQSVFMGNLSSDVDRHVIEWQTKTVGEIADTQLGKMLNKGKQSGKHAKPYLRTDNVHWGRFDLSEIKEMDILPEELDKYLATKGDLLMCEGGASGRTAIWNEDYDISFQNHVHRIRPRKIEEVSPNYLLYYFEWFIKNGFANDLIKGVTISSLSQSGLRSIEVTYPLIREQLEIVGLLEDHLSRLDASVSLADAMEKQSNGLRRSLLNAAFTGQLAKEVVSV
jgi:type I restriction enzyme S subunit